MTRTSCSIEICHRVMLLYEPVLSSRHPSSSLFTMQKARIDKGIEFAYLDSGVPGNSITYRTLVVVHGHTFHARSCFSSSNDINVFKFCQ